MHFYFDNWLSTQSAGWSDTLFNNLIVKADAREAVGTHVRGREGKRDYLLHLLHAFSTPEHV